MSLMDISTLILGRQPNNDFYSKEYYKAYEKEKKKSKNFLR